MTETPHVPGSPRWWRERGQQAASPGRGPGRPSMPAERVVAAALELVDEAGPEEFSMRMLAQRLGSSTATLYRNFAGKDEILVLVADHILGEVPRHFTATTEAADWRERLLALAEALFATLKAHHRAVALFAGGLPLGPRALAGREAAIAILLDSGFSPKQAAQAYTAAARYVVGFAAQMHTGDSSAEDDREVLDFFRSLDPGDYPATVRTAPFLPSSLEDEFRFGLRLLVDGLAAHLGDP